MEWIETTGKTVADARELALDKLGVDESEAEFEVIEEPKSGLFGRTRGTARVRARVSPKAAPAKNERKRRPKKKEGAGSASSSENAAKGSESTGAGTSRQGGGGQSRGGSNKPTGQKSGSAKSADSGTKAVTKPTEESGSDNRTRNENKPKSERNDKRVNREPMDNDEQIQVVENFLAGLLGAFGLEGTLQSSVDDKDLVTNISGQNLGLLVTGARDTRSGAGTYRLALQREAEGSEYARVSIDVEGIRQERKASLERFVAEQSALVKDSGKTVVFEDMSSADRKQVHDLASAIDGVKSVSEGEDPSKGGTCSSGVVTLQANAQEDRWRPDWSPSAFWGPTRGQSHDLNWLNDGHSGLLPSPFPPTPPVSVSIRTDVFHVEQVPERSRFAWADPVCG
ncbi:MAG: Jag N-terminal domain-containing protein [Microthrixaceae bacterium]